MNGYQIVLLIYSLLLISINTNAAELYKCTSKDGRKVFQSHPCKGSLKLVVTPPIDAGDKARPVKEFQKKKPEAQSAAVLHSNIQREVSKLRDSASAKSLYVLTRVMEVPDKYCDRPFKKQFSDFKDFFEADIEKGKKHFELVNSSTTLEERNSHITRLKNSREKQYRKTTKASFCKWNMRTLQEFQTAYFK